MEAIIPKVFLLVLVTSTLGQSNDSNCLENQVTWFFSHVTKNPRILLDKRFHSRVIPLEHYPFNIGLILNLSCRPQRSNDTNTASGSLGRYVVTQNVESKELVIFCHGPQTQQDRPKMMDIDNWNPNEIQFRRSPDIVTKPSNFSVQSLTTSTTEKAIKDTSKPAESRETIDGLYHSPGQHDIRIHKKKDNEHSEHVHQQLSEEWVDYKAAFYFTLFLWLFSLLTLLLAWLSKSECKANRRAGGAGRRRPNINEEEPAELEDRVEALPALLSVSLSDEMNEEGVQTKESSSVIAVKTTPKSEKHHPDFYNHTPIVMSPHRLSISPV